MAILGMKKQIMLTMMAVAVAGLFCLPLKAHATDSMNLNAQKIEAGLIYNFLKYTTWPSATLSGEKTKLSVCLFGDDAFDGYLYPLEGRTAQQFTISIRHIYNVNSIDSCHVVFIHESQRHNLRAIFSRLKGKNILSISNIPNFAKQGGMVEFNMGQDKHIHLHINRNSIGTAGLHIEDRLVKLAKVVQ
jgi:hypothetical protein